MSTPLAFVAIEIANALVQKTLQGQALTEFEHQLYESASRYAATVLRFQDACSQSALIKAERELDDLSGAKAG